MKTMTSLVGGLGCGAALMYLFDPNAGRRRRAQARDKAVRLLHDSEDAVARAGRDAGNRARGLAAEARSRLSHDEASDDVLIQRVRARLGHYASHASALEVSAEQGVVTLRGKLTASEIPEVVSAARSVRGVSHIENYLEEDPHAAAAPRQETGYWTPSERLLAAAGAGALVGWGTRMPRLPRWSAGLAGAGLFARAVSNKDMATLLGYGPGAPIASVQKTVNIDAPVERVFEFWANYENFPRFMTHVREVRDLGNGRSHWVAAGPAGTPVEWSAQVTRLEPNRLLCWKTVPGSAVCMEGRVRFDANPAGGTRIDVRIAYCPPAGALGHAVAALFGADPKQAMIEDLARLKSLLEHGKTSVHGHVVTKEKLSGVARTLVPGEEEKSQKLEARS